MTRALLSLLLVGCAQGALITDDVLPEAGSPDTPSMCTSFCGNTCVDLKTDTNNCGKCGTVCPTGASCIQGSCQCMSGSTKCNNQCVDTKTDTNNCGKCGTVCGGDGGNIMGGGTWGCANGTCSIICPMGKTECAGACTDTKTDNDNCGMCGNACAMGTETCMQGLCCKTGEMVCNNACADTKFDAKNCGMCGNACPMNAPNCSNGMCVAGVTYTQSFTQGQSSSSQCTAWNTFRASLSGMYSSITVRGSQNMVGVTCTGSGANTLCQALRNNQTVTVANCGGRNWRTGPCGGGIELSANGDTCACSSGYIVRPCIGNSNWGGINGVTCNAPTQTMTVLCQ